MAIDFAAVAESGWWWGRDGGEGEDTTELAVGSAEGVGRRRGGFGSRKGMVERDGKGMVERDGR